MRRPAGSIGLIRGFIAPLWQLLYNGHPSSAGILDNNKKNAHVKCFYLLNGHSMQCHDAASQGQLKM